MQAFALVEAKLAARQAELDRLNAMATNGEEKAMKEARLEELTRESQEASELKREVEQQLKFAQAPIKKLERDSQQLQREIQHAEKRLAAAEARLREARQEMQQREAESEQVKRLKELDVCKEKLAALVDEEKGLREQQANELRNYQDLEPIVDGNKERCQNLQRQMGAVRHKISSLHKSQGNSAAVYGGPNAARLVEQVRIVGIVASTNYFVVRGADTTCFCVASGSKAAVTEQMERPSDWAYRGLHQDRTRQGTIRRTG
jgi:chromosome segregation ATPase